MIKIILSLLVFFITFASVSADECEPNQISAFQKELGTITYDLSYSDNYVDMNGDFLEGYFNLKGINLPTGYFIATTVEDGVQFYDPNNGLYLKGGVYVLEIYHSSCDGTIKTIEVKIPTYKQYCDLDIKCVSDDVWFDGTYENKTVNEILEEKNGINTKLVIVLVSLVIIIIMSTVIILVFRRRQGL